MKAAVVHAFGQALAIEEVPVPDVPPGHVLVKIAASGVCHTDLYAADQPGSTGCAAARSRAGSPCA